ncbi:protein-methionine-sulfoxide reductase catalytic subunit MsrP [Marinobacter sp. M216]|uniref:Protein-methionine-sulfoxide reductase catalytic subunit MsrP n=1 Tax=Marinobacter albus TaxID=3030833 RepID=A0ABT7HIW2_9GAMM|nr:MULTISPECIES: protein-methionine-sulfoxide reductase catalytic subunit MsrP [unclassified Marinobacter]MBW7473116.1 protein-methionine-sulfoxide reductase catalytic subunit MsrP [Marinobacter sp. F4218]MDK9559491.1 protein-methionine-sulfoxide reductase catalytic subunit MsrP [Marinobacter sp. M216]
MFINKRPSWALPHSLVTPERIYLDRRRFMSGAMAGVAGLAVPGLLPAAALPEQGESLVFSSTSRFSTDEEKTPYEDVIRYNNFYEFGTGKDDPARYADEMSVDPWSIAVEGECEKPGVYGLEDVLEPHRYEERVYRLRCVEAWSMVIPWIGVPLAEVLERFEPNSKAKYVYFETLHDPEQMRAQRSMFSTIDWPYQEGLRMDEAMNELAFLAVGLYGKTIPKQNGAPIRLVVPWKYGFKSIKSIVKIRFQEERPKTTWEMIAPREYGFYANVNPEVDHPRWSQKRERRLPSGLLSPNWVETEKFNGYGDQVAHLYEGMDLRKFY